MRAVVQRVSRAKVTVNDWVAGEIGLGLLVLLGVGHGDTEVDATYLDDRVAFREERKRRGRDEVARRFGLLIDQVEAIGRRGDAEHWPLIDDPKPDPSSEAADRIALGVLALSLLVAFCGIVYCALFRRSLLVEAYTAVVIAWRRYGR